jgi:hypothetical protein
MISLTIEWINRHKKASDYSSLAGLNIDFARQKPSEGIAKIAGITWDARVIPVL